MGSYISVDKTATVICRRVIARLIPLDSYDDQKGRGASEMIAKASI
jgi:hypothetical protein